MNMLFLELEGIETAAYQYGYFSSQYYAAVQIVDSLVGTIIKTLKDTGLEDRTTVSTCKECNITLIGHYNIKSWKTLYHRTRLYGLNVCQRSFYCSWP
jgi:hypothetical protein